MILPLMVLLIILSGIKNKVDIYDTFIEGSKESFKLILELFPCMLAMIFGINIFLNSNAIDYLFIMFKPIFKILSVPIEVFPMMLLRPISGSASLAFLNNLLAKHGPDSLIGLIGSVIQGSTDTTLYIITLYFGSVGIKKIRYALYVGLFADLIGIISSIIIVKMIF